MIGLVRRVLFGGGLGFLVLLLGLGGGYAWYANRMSSPVSANAGRVSVGITNGMSWDAAVELLQYEGLVQDPWLFELRARQRHRRVPLRAGLFVFDRSWTPDHIMDKLAAGPDGDDPDAPLIFQIIPGENFFRVREKLVELGVRGDLVGFDRSREKVDDLGIPAPYPLPPGALWRLEGYLYPDSYHLDRRKPTVERAIKAATKRFHDVFAELRKKHKARRDALAKEFGFHDADFVTLSSLIEKETQAKAEAPMVAAVFYNRLRRKMALATDPTLVYGPTTWKDVPSKAHRLDKSNPYNTYVNKGLPPGPICSPSAASLEAALAPAESAALYFVARRDGTGRHAFADDYETHKANIERYLRSPPAGSVRPP